MIPNTAMQVDDALRRIAQLDIVRHSPELRRIPELVRQVFAEGPLADRQSALQSVAGELLASGTVHPQTAAILAPLCPLAPQLDERLQVQFWHVVAYACGAMTQPSGRVAHENLRPHARSFIERRMRSTEPGTPMMCALAAVSVAYPDWGRLAAPAIMRGFRVPPPGSAVRAVAGLGLLGLGVHDGDVLFDLNQLRKNDAEGDLSNALALVLDPPSDVEFAAERVLDAMSECALGFWGNLTVGQRAGVLPTG